MSRRLLGAVLLLVAAVAAVVGTFLPLYTAGAAYRENGPLTVTTSWKVEFHLPDGVDFGDVRSPQYGVPVVVSAVLLALVMALVFLPEAQRLAARYLALAATGLLVGSVWTTGSVILASLGNANRPESEGYEVEVGEGIWVLVAAAVVAVVGTVLLHGRRAEPRPRGAVVYRVDDDVADADDTDTPPFGIPVVEVVQLPETGHDRR